MVQKEKYLLRSLHGKDGNLNVFFCSFILKRQNPVGTLVKHEIGLGGSWHCYDCFVLLFQVSVAEEASDISETLKPVVDGVVEVGCSTDCSCHPQS